MRIPILGLLFALSASSPAATFTITHFGTPAGAQPAIERAAEIWGSILVSDVPIKVAVSWFPLGASALGVTFPNGRKDFPGAPVASTWYASCLANSIAGTELNPGEDDINVYLNASTNWYLGLDGNTPTGQYDLVTIALHELGHGLGFVGLAKKTGAEGSFGQVLMSDFAPLITTFPWPEQEGLPGIFDRYLTSTANGPLIDLTNPSNALGTAFTSNQVFFNGSYAMAANGGQQARIYAPGSFAIGSSCVHLNESTYPVGNPNELMTPFGSPGNANHWPGPIAIGIMRDIGWVVNPVSMPEFARASAWTITFSNDGRLLCSGLRPTERLRLIDAQGRTLREDAHEHLTAQGLASGSYIALRVSTGEGKRFVLPE
ncbi:MAG TPA: hypothetical protein PKY96_09815 [Flavobacteriales bacterium]|nr:hypothetical protein [Flavobacteriales bacterium]